MGGSGQRKMEEEAEKETPNYIVKPTFATKFKPMEVRQVMERTIASALTNVSYNPEEKIVEMTKKLSNAIKNNIKEELQLPRYKFVVQVAIAEQKGQGVKMGCRSFWDTETDNYAEVTYTNDTLICIATCFGIYFP